MTNEGVGISFYLFEHIIIYPYLPDNRKTYIYELCNRENENIQLGEIKWNSKWRRYCYYPTDEIVLDSQCLKTITSFIDKLNLDHKLERKGIKEVRDGKIQIYSRI